MTLAKLNEEKGVQRWIPLAKLSEDFMNMDLDSCPSDSEGHESLVHFYLDLDFVLGHCSELVLDLF